MLNFGTSTLGAGGGRTLGPRPGSASENYNVFEKKKELYHFVQLNKLFTISSRTKQSASFLSICINCSWKVKRCFLLKSHCLWHESIKPEEVENENHAIFSLLITLTAAMCKIKEKHQKIFDKKIKSVFRSIRTFVVDFFVAYTHPNFCYGFK